MLFYSKKAFVIHILNAKAPKEMALRQLQECNARVRVPVVILQTGSLLLKVRCENETVRLRKSSDLITTYPQVK